jgi:4-hydroxy 2-oxovalerate aldolase
MGRGAGNLHTELIANFINDDFKREYDIDRILQIYDEHLHIFRDKYNWGYSLPYFLSAVHKCHPNYGTYLINRATLPVTDIGVLLTKIPEDKKRFYSEELINALYVEHISNIINDSAVYEYLKAIFTNEEILLLGPAKSLITHAQTILDYIGAHNPVVISVNHIADRYPIDFAFFSNRKRFNERQSNIQLILTSNIKYSGNDALIVDYTKLCNQQGKFSDISILLLLSLLHRIGCTSVSLAAFDGYSGKDDYYDKSYQNTFWGDWIVELNAAVKKAIKMYSRHMSINFITPSYYGAVEM